ncbi:MAG: sulfite exporter TauE/SafE family protein [Hyphomicrobium sp.]
MISYWGVYDGRTLKIMIPGAMVGIAVGWLTASYVTETHIRLIVGLISILFAVQFFLQRGKAVLAAPQNAAKGTFWAILTGFTSFVSHAGGPPYQVYTAPLRLEPQLFAGTSVILFALINAVKLIPYSSSVSSTPRTSPPPRSSCRSPFPRRWSASGWCGASIPGPSTTSSTSRSASSASI